MLDENKKPNVQISVVLSLTNKANRTNFVILYLKKTRLENDVILFNGSFKFYKFTSYLNK